jgi:hypothetical protein
MSCSSKPTPWLHSLAQRKLTYDELFQRPITLFSISA